MDKYFHDAASAYLMAAFGMTLAPLLEELFFRGLLYPMLRRAFGLVIAVVLTAAAFAAIHGTQLGYAWAPILSIFVVGVVFTDGARAHQLGGRFVPHALRVQLRPVCAVVAGQRSLSPPGEGGQLKWYR